MNKCSFHPIRSWCLIALFFGVLLAILPIVSLAEPVRIESVEGDVRFRAGADSSWRMLNAGMTLPAPVEIKSSSGAKAVIVQSGSSFKVKGDTHLALTSNQDEPEGLVTRVKQWLGTVFYDIERQPDTFSVETPFLVSTVKGTQFVVVSTETSSFVTLNEGRLEVLDIKTGTKKILNSGEIAGSSLSQAGVQTMKQVPLANSLNTGATPSGQFPANSTMKSEYSLNGALDSIGDVATGPQQDIGNDLASDIGVDIGSDIGVDVVANIGSGIGVDVGADIGSGIGVDVGADIGSGIGVDVGADIGSGIGVDVGADIGIGGVVGGITGGLGGIRLP